ncbi:MAG: hypothetical protein HY057_08350 [Rhodospirillales bacterium]|nr:hypothetical protein [Rhodospirillales bacterium]
MRSARQPFILYSIVGYLIPGAALVAILAYLFRDQLQMAGIPGPGAWSTGTALVALGFLLAAAYIAGQIAAIVSAETLGRLVVAFTGQPSHFLTAEYVYSGDYFQRTITRNILDASAHAFFWAVQYLPFILYAWAFELFNLTGAFRCLLRKLDKGMIARVDERFTEAFGATRAKTAPHDWFALVAHHVMDRNPPAGARMYDYVMLYGFCRNAALVCYIGGLGFVCKFIRLGFQPWMLLMALAFLAAGFVLVLGFLKFYRRHAEETLLSFALPSAKAAS